MNYKFIFVLLEGGSDQKLFSSVLKNEFGNEVIVNPWKFCCRKKFKTIDLVNTIQKMKDKSLPYDYLYFKDFDKATCYTMKRDEILNFFNHKGHNRISQDRMVIVREEIESWYIAGVNRDFLISLGIEKWIDKTNNLTKEEFYSFIPRKMPEILFRTKICENFDIDLAKSRNISFKYFMEDVLPRILNS